MTLQMGNTSIKGVLLLEGGVVLVKNPRGEWELPGGRPDAGETPEATLAREFAEELALHVRVEGPIDSYSFEVIPGRTVRIATHGRTLRGAFAPRISDEHSTYCICPVSELRELNLPAGYRQSIERWAAAAPDQSCKTADIT